LVDTYWRFSCDGIELGGQARRRAGVVPLLLRLMEFGETAESIRAVKHRAYRRRAK
jgi:hypothetical protein